MEERIKIQRRQSAVPEAASIFARSRRSSSDTIVRSPSVPPEFGHDFRRISILPIQAKLAVSQPHDAAELEAERVATQVMNSPAPQDSDFVNSQEKSEEIAPKIQQAAVQRECASCEEEDDELMRQADGSHGMTDGAIAQVHRAVNSGGQPLDAATRNFMEPRFGHDFSQVKIHTDTQAATSAQAGCGLCCG
jgi:hypothetical protein